MIRSGDKVSKKAILMVFVVIFMLAAVTCQGAPKGDILIGVCTGLTGAAPMDGERTKQGVTLAVEEINKKGGVLGKNLRVTFEDDQATPNGAVNAVNKLCSENIVGLIGPHLSGNVMAVQGIVQRAQLPMLTGGTSPALLNANNPWFFRIRASDAIVAPIATKYLIENLKCKKIGMIFDNDAFGTGAKNVVADYLKTINLPFFAEGYNTGDTDMTGQILKLKDAGVDGLLVWGHDVEDAIVAKQVKQLDLKGPFIGNPGFAMSHLLDLIGTTNSEGLYTVTDFIANSPEPEIRKYVKNFEKKYNNIQPELYATAYYGAVYVLADAIKRAGSTDKEKIRTALLQTKKLRGVMCTYTANAKGEMVHEAIVAIIKNKVPQKIKVIRN